MDTIKIIQKFFNKKDALKAASYQKELAKKSNQKISIEIIEAYKIHSSVKNKIGNPRPDDFIIIIKRQTTSIIKKAIKKIKTIIKSIFNPKPQTKPIPFMEVSTPSYYSKVLLAPNNRPNIIPIVAPFSLCSQV
jgi:hypothetical protein